MLVLLDRDGVINEDLPQGVTQPEEWRILPGALEGIALLTHAGFHVAIVTNQSAIAKGLLQEETLHALHDRLLQEAVSAGGHIDAIYCCTDHPDLPSPRRKPAPGMLLEALADFGADAATTFFIGDAERDLEAAAAAGCPFLLVKTGKGQLTLNKGLSGEVQPMAVVDDLPAAARYVIHHCRHRISE